LNLFLPHAQSALNQQIIPRCFTRRTDLSAVDRLTIASEALLSNSYGVISHLAEKYAISRTFVYQLAERLEQVVEVIFGDRHEQKAQAQAARREQAIRLILSLRMEGRASIGGVACVAKRLMDKFNSVGFASETLTYIGEKLPCVIEHSGQVLHIILAIDELFSKKQPILISVDPCSSAILSIQVLDSRLGTDWAAHLNALKAQGIQVAYVVSDEGSGILSGCEQALPDTKRQSDTFHAIALKLGLFVERLERAAFTAMEYEYKIEATLASAKSERVSQNRQAKYTMACHHTQQKIQRYEEFIYTYRCLINELKLFDADGNLRSDTQAIAGVEACLSLLESLQMDKVNAVVKQIRNTIPTLFHHFEVAKSVVANFAKLKLNTKAIKLYCAAWQWNKSERCAKTTPRRHHAHDMEQLCLEMAEGLHQHDFENENNPRALLGQTIYRQLDTIIQSSAMVECINSILRPYLNCSKNHITQAFLNLFMFYHNHRRYVDGVRKGKTPMELLTGTIQSEDWIDLLLTKVA
jgi:hypothetical protein